VQTRLFWHACRSRFEYRSEGQTSDSAVAANQSNLVVAKLTFRSKVPPAERTNWETAITIVFTSADSTGESHVLVDDGLGSDRLSEATPVSIAISAADVPGAPVITGIQVQDGQLLVSFEANADNGSPIVSYEVSCGSESAVGTQSPIAVTNLDNGIQYSCSVIATNAQGESQASGSLSGTPEAVIRRLNIILIKAAVDAQNN
jgi:hypothetical protein